MKKLSEFENEKAVEAMSRILPAIENISKVPENSGEWDTLFGFAGAICKNNPKDILEILATLSDVPAEEYHCNLATLIHDTMQMLTDPSIKELFGLQS